MSDGPIKIPPPSTPRPKPPPAPASLRTREVVALELIAESLDRIAEMYVYKTNREI